MGFIPHINEEPMKQNEKYGCESADEQQQDDEKNRQQWLGTALSIRKTDSET